ncbi:Membrane glycoprotein [Patulibacter medicamentivorans]|uniref:Membrane glycoprotein n=1 Tax=Patulibacter medicamentivorans TaxID=1097667 RepID=H0E9Z1_9ACTN|nr:hypothetical protein [Patulibacter medicamentivorans]EHN09504.1 Membrane glycoprotein [Patulibacter medicamentivorans]
MSASRSVRARPAAAAADVRPPRPASLLGAAAAVPLGAAVLLAAALLPTGGRVALGTALVVLGIALWTQETGFTGLRIGAPLLAALKPLLIGGGGLLVAAGAAIWIGHDEGEPLSGLVVAVPLGVLLALLTGLQRIGAPRQAAAAGHGAGERAKAWSATVGTVAALLIAVLVMWVVGTKPRVENADGGTVLVTLVAVVLGAMALVGDHLAGARRPTAGTSSPPAIDGRRWLAERIAPTAVSDAAAVAALVLVALTIREATSVLTLVGVPGGLGIPRAGVQAGAVVLGDLLAVVLLVRAVLRRDAVTGMLAGAILVAAVGGADTTDLQVARLLPPTLAAVAAVVLWWGPRAVRERVEQAGVGWPAPQAAARWAVALMLVAIAALANVTELFVHDPPLRVATVTIAVVALGAVAPRLVGSPGRLAGITTLALLAVNWPWWQVFEPDVARNADGELVELSASAAPWVGELLAAVGPIVLLAPVIARLRRRVRWPVADALVAAIAVTALSSAAIGLTVGLPLTVTLDDARDGRIVQATPLLVSALLASGLAAMALLGPARRVAAAQAAAALVLTMASAHAYQVGSMTYSVSGFYDVISRPAAGVAVALVLLAGTLLAASTARRPSGAAAFGALVAVPAATVLVASISTAWSRGGEARSVDLLDLVYGAEPLGSPLQHARPGWPLLLAMLGLTLLVAAALLERSRPAPAGAPVRRR